MSLTPTVNPTNAVLVPAAAIPQEQMLAAVSAQQTVMMAKMQEAMQALANNQSAKDKTIEDLKEQLTDCQAALKKSEEMNQQLITTHAAALKALQDKQATREKLIDQELKSIEDLCTADVDRIDQHNKILDYQIWYCDLRNNGNLYTSGSSDGHVGYTADIVARIKATIKPEYHPILHSNGGVSPQQQVINSFATMKNSVAVIRAAMK